MPRRGKRAWQTERRMGTQGNPMPVSAIFENIEAGANIDDIMEWFDGLDREQVKAVIEFAARSLDKPLSMLDNAGFVRSGNARAHPPVSGRPYGQHRCARRMGPASKR
jgi:hypothetical protein